jgi:outer membrane protein assembly factor BamE (lipoprotein component of BamABCDE complex)
MKSSRVPVSVACVLAVLAACALLVPQESRYLRGAKDHATQSEVKQQLGEPQMVASTLGGDPQWVYQYREEDPGSRWTSVGMRCDEYVLTFDKAAILRDWTYRTHVHGGELMPTYCVPGGMDDPRAGRTAPAARN